MEFFIGRFNRLIVQTFHPQNREYCVSSLVVNINLNGYRIYVDIMTVEKHLTRLLVSSFIQRGEYGKKLGTKGESLL